MLRILASEFAFEIDAFIWSSSNCFGVHVALY